MNYIFCFCLKRLLKKQQIKDFLFLRKWKIQWTGDPHTMRRKRTKRNMRSEYVSDFKMPVASMAAGSFYVNTLILQGFFTRKRAQNFEILPQVQGK